MRFSLGRVAALLFCSGACALVYQTAWLRELRLIFGASTSASAAVLAVFMGGLGAGGAVLGRRVDRAPNPLRTYARLELWVAAAAAVTPVLVELADAAYLRAGGTSTLGSFVATILRLALSVAVLGPTTFVMGGTMPAAARAVEREGDSGRQRVAALYGINTLGAVAGAVAANFLLLEVFGTRLTLWLACLVNALVGVIAHTASRSPERLVAAAEDRRKPEPVTESASASPGAVAALRWFPPVTAAVAGATFMLMELVWYRMLAPILGGSSYTFGLILAVALAGIGIGGAIYSRTRITPTFTTFALTCAVEGLVIAIPYALGDRLALLALLLKPLASSGFGAAVGVWAVVTSIVVLPAAVVSGAQFPLVIGLYGRGADSVGRDVGAAYLANTLGAIAGAIAGGFGLLPGLSAPTCWKLVVAVLVVVAVAALALDAASRRTDGLARFVGVTAASSGLVALGLLTATGPTAVWRHSGIGAGRALLSLDKVTTAGITAFERNEAARAIWETDGVESGVALVADNAYAFVVNGKADGNALGDAPTQVMSGVLGALLHPNPRTALIVGLGTGSTAGWLGAIPSIERVDVVELEPAILRIARACAPVNRSVLENPKVHVHMGDAREALRTARDAYDIVFSEPSNPYRAGISSLYTEEFYRAAAGRLREHGLFVQWVQSYDVDAWAVATAIVTLKQVFTDVSVWETMPGDLLLIAQKDAAVVDVDRIRERLREPTYAAAARDVWRTESAEGILAHFVASGKLADALIATGVGAVNRDDQNLLEFAFARGVGRRQRVDGDLLALASRLGFEEPRRRGAVDPQMVLEERWLQQLYAGRPLSPPPATAPPEARAFGAFASDIEAGHFKAALDAWKKLDRRPRAFLERLFLAEGAAFNGAADAATWITDVPNAGDRELLTGIWALKRGERDRAVAALERGLVMGREDPWIEPTVEKRALELVLSLPGGDPVVARRMLAALDRPFAVEALRQQRLHTRVRVAAGIDARTCAEAMHAVEPAPWEPDLLRLRLRCYRDVGDPLLPAAKADVATLEADQGAFATALVDDRPRAPRAAAAAPPPSEQAAPTPAADAAGATDGARP